MLEKEKIFVAGHRGLVGSALVRKLREKGYENLALRGKEELDLRDREAVLGFFEEERPGAVLMAAGVVGGIKANDTYPVEFLRDNLQIELNVIEGAWKAGVKKYVFLGSSCIYPKFAEQPIREEALLTGPLEPTNQWYAVAKIAGIKLCQAYRREHGFPAISLMPTNLYGVGDNFDLVESHVLPAMLRKFHLGRRVAEGDLEAVKRDEKRFGEIPGWLLEQLGVKREREGFVRVEGKEPKVVLWGTGMPRREFLYVDDLAEACIFLMENYDGEEIVNVGTGEDVSLMVLADMIRRIVGFQGEVVWDANYPDGTPRKLLDVSRIKGMGWAPKVSLQEGVERVYQWYLGEL